MHACVQACFILPVQQNHSDATRADGDAHPDSPASDRTAQAASIAVYRGSRVQNLNVLHPLLPRRKGLRRACAIVRGHRQGCQLQGNTVPGIQQAARCCKLPVAGRFGPLLDGFVALYAAFA